MLKKYSQYKFENYIEILRQTVLVLKVIISLKKVNFLLFVLLLLTLTTSFNMTSSDILATVSKAEILVLSYIQH